MSQFEQRANIKFMCRLGKSASETLLALQTVYGDDSLMKTAVYEWFSRFKDGQESLEDEREELGSKCVCSDGAYFEGD